VAVVVSSSVSRPRALTRRSDLKKALVMCQSCRAVLPSFSLAMRLRGARGDLLIKMLSLTKRSRFLIKDGKVV
jgi:hypothetical protein